MRRFLQAKAGLVALALLALALTGGVAWAAGLNTPWAQTEDVTPELVIMPPVVTEGSTAITVAGSGFKYDASRPEGFRGERVILQLEGATERPLVISADARARVSGAFSVQIASLPASVGPGAYTVTALGIRGSKVVTHPIVVLEKPK